MRFSIFKKAKDLQGKVYLQGTTSNRAWFSFKELDDPPVVILKLEPGKYTYLEACTCTHHSIHGGMPNVDMKNLCSYVIAVYKSLPFEKSELFKEND